MRLTTPTTITLTDVTAYGLAREVVGQVWAATWHENQGRNTDRTDQDALNRVMRILGKLYEDAKMDASA